MCVSVTIDGVWIGDRIFYTLWYRALLQVRIILSLFYTLHKSLEDTLVLLTLLQSSVAVSRQWLPTADVPLSLGSRNVPSLSYQLLTATAHNDWTAAVLFVTCPPYSISHGSRRKHRSSVAVQLFPLEHACLRSRYFVTDVAETLISRSSPVNVSTCYSTNERNAGLQLKIFI
jgi:hypothetical protein